MNSQGRARRRVTLLVAVAVLAGLPVQVLGESNVKRGTLMRQGRAWVERLECTSPARDGEKLVLRADFGSVTVSTGASDRMDCQVVLRAFTSSQAEANRLFDRYELGVRPLERGGVYVSGTGGEQGRGVSMSAELNLKVPGRFNLDLETKGGDIKVQSALDGEVRATTAGGEIRTGDVTGPVFVETAGGSITLGNLGQQVKAETAGGSIRVGNIKGDATLETSGGEIVTGQVEGSVRAETAGGDVVIGGSSSAVVAKTAGGQIQIGPAAGTVRAETAGGSIRLRGARGKVTAETAGGSIDLFQIEGAIKASTAAGRILAQIKSARKTFAASQLETAMGDIEVFLPPDLALTIDAAIEMAGGHRIISDFPLDILGNREEFLPREIRGKGALNGGGETLRIRSVNGNIEIRKLDARTLEQLKERQDADWKNLETRRTE